MYCKNCGSKLVFKIGTCKRCGLNYDFRTSDEKKEENKGFKIGWAILGFFLPVIGLMLFLAWRKTNKVKSKSVGAGALIGELLSIVITIAMVVVLVLSVALGFFKPLLTALNDGKEKVEIVEPTPENAKFSDSADGTLKFNVVESSSGYACAFDKKTQTVIGRDYNSVYLYKAWGGEPYNVRYFDGRNTTNRKVFNYPIRCLDAENGIVAIGFGEARSITIISVEYGLTFSISTEIAVNAIKITDDYVVYSNTEEEKYCEIRAMRLDNRIEKTLGLYYSPSFDAVADINRIFVSEKGTYETTFKYVDIDTTGEKELDQAVNGEAEVFYDGEYIHALGRLYTQNGKLAWIGQSPDFDEKIRFYSQILGNGEYRVISTSNCQTALYSKNNGGLVRVYDLYATEAYYIGGGKFIALCGNSGYFANFSVIPFSVPAAYYKNFEKRKAESDLHEDITPIPEGIDDKAEEIKYGRFGVERGFKKILYDEATGRVYALYSGKIDAYEVDSGEKILSLEIKDNPSDMCIGEGVIAVGYGDKGVIDIIDVKTRKTRSVDTQAEKIGETAFVGGSVVFTENAKKSKVYFLDSNTGEISCTEEDFFSPVIESDKNATKILVAETGQNFLSAYFIEVAGERKVSKILYSAIEKCGEGRAAAKPYYDGKYFHVYGKMLFEDHGSIASEKEYINYKVEQRLKRQICENDAEVLCVNDKRQIVVIDKTTEKVKRVINAFATSAYEKDLYLNCFLIIDDEKGEFAVI